MSMSRRNLVLYVLLNVFISACVTGAILFWYDRNYRATNQPAAQELPSNNASIPTADLGGTVSVKIASVVGAGTLNAEIVVVKFEGEGQLDLTGWQLKDEDGNTFVFPQIILYTNGAVQVHTVAGTNTVIDLYWGLRDPVWESGEEAKLFDPQGNVRATYGAP
jgi:uncharacterized membrane protein